MGYFGSVNIFWFFKCPHSRPPRDPLASCQSRQPFIVRPKLKVRFRWLDSSREEVSSSSRMDLCLSIAQRSYLWQPNTKVLLYRTERSLTQRLGCCPKEPPPNTR